MLPALQEHEPYGQGSIQEIDPIDKSWRILQLGRTRSKSRHMRRLRQWCEDCDSDSDIVSILERDGEAHAGRQHVTQSSASALDHLLRLPCLRNHRLNYRRHRRFCHLDVWLHFCRYGGHCSTCLRLRHWSMCFCRRLCCLRLLLAPPHARPRVRHQLRVRRLRRNVSGD